MQRPYDSAFQLGFRFGGVNLCLFNRLIAAIVRSSSSSTVEILVNVRSMGFRWASWNASLFGLSRHDIVAN